ncbi:MAG: glycoside hydrolase family 3 C-terminal domain-containing protein [Terracidiphilus sp.]|jgi:beta-glucosidase
MQQTLRGSGTRRVFITLFLSFAVVFGGLAVRAQSAHDEKQIDDAIAKMTLEEKIHMLSGATMMSSAGIPRLGIPAFRMSDGPMGAHVPPPSTAYAAGIGLAASWDRDLATKVGVQIGRDARSRGASYLLGPGVNIYRAPLNGRNFEYFGEDPFLAAETAVGYIDGVQSQGVSATIKHYAANNSEYFRFTEDSVVSERALREIYLPAFEAAVRKAHVGAIMDSYNLLNGQHATENYHLNVEIAKQQWGFGGVLMSDWWATHDGVAAANGGLDLEMPFGYFMNEKTLLPAVKDGKVKESVIDDKIRRLLRDGYRFGWIARDPLDTSIPRYNQQGRLAALQSAREGIVLLKNQGNLLPLDPAKVKTIAVIGPDAFPAIPTAGGSGQIPTFTEVSALKGIGDRLGVNANVVYDRGVPKLSILAVRTGFMQALGKFALGLTVETFDNPEFSGKPIATRTEMFANSGQNILDSPDLTEVINSIPAQLMMSMMPSGPTATTKFERWTGFYFARAHGNYVVFAENQGKYWLKIDDATVIDHSEIPKFALTQRVVPLTPGPHKVVMDVLGPPQFGEAQIKIGIVQEGTLVNQSAIDLARKADAVVVAVGFDQDIETEGADREFQLPPGQEELIEKIAAVNPNTIVTVTAGGSVDASRWLDHVAALLENWYPGQEGGTALAEVLFGDVNPTGRLPISWEKSLADNPSYAYYYPTPGTLTIPYKDDVFVGYRGYEHDGVKPLFPFGFGLSYTTFKYSWLKIHPGAEPGAYEVSFEVTNTGTRAGADVAQVYISEDHPEVPRPPQELKGFARVVLEPGQSRRVTVPLDARSFTWYDEKAAAWRAAAGSFTIRVSRSSADPQLEGKIRLAQAIVLPVQQ